MQGLECPHLNAALTHDYWNGVAARSLVERADEFDDPPIQWLRELPAIASGLDTSCVNSFPAWTVMRWAGGSSGTDVTEPSIACDPSTKLFFCLRH